ncbi:hypothetical protein CLV62_11853 [Dysgonomonas alginatilytica]|uniref:Uncharacterized protein n=1 Tax=Dysgonomonas alginatilytica TaxID=1605892 RepID=A0A2V3PNT8_9BACT|nr:hypothetical protein [Dysgonomonas alginatilytica]PXV62664.1 hypothetical protein CLV62_11853 [Dysgonomonas alginatilytica]
MKFLFFSLLYIVCINSFAQEFDKQNIYYKALKSHFEYIEASNKKYPNLWKMSDLYYIEKDDLTTKNFPDSIMSYKIELLSLPDIREKTNKKRSISIFAVRPAQWENGKLLINVIQFSVSRRGNDYSYMNMMDGTSYQVIYDSNIKEYSLLPIK